MTRNAWFCAALALAGSYAATAQTPKHLTARAFNSEFPLSNGTFNGMLAASDGKIYYVLCAASIDTGAQMYVYDPATDRIRHAGDLTEAAGEKGLKTVPQGKSHVNFVEASGKLYFATHVDWYEIRNGMETMGTAPPGYKPYPGGHFLAYDMGSGKFSDLAKAPAGQGIISMNMDTTRGRMYGLTWPSANFLRYDLKTGELKNFGPMSKEGEGGRGPTYRVICRSLAVDPDDGSVYFTTADGDILRYRYDRDSVETVQHENMRKDYFGSFDPSAAGSMGYNWRQTVWYAPEKAIYGVHGRSGYLFRFDPRAERVDLVERITSEPSKRSGMFDQFAYGYLSFTLGPDGHTVYYLTGGAILDDSGKRAAKKGEEDLHLVTYDIPAAKYTDHGAIFLANGERPKQVNSIAVGRDGAVYSLGEFTENGHRRVDLFRIPAISNR